MAVVLVAALNGIAVLQAYFRVFTGKRHAAPVSLSCRWQERLAVLSLALLILGGGVYPQPGLSSRHLAATRIIESRRIGMGLDSAEGRGEPSPFWWSSAPNDAAPTRR
jgi:NADH-quinone oxidoreductase subunit M